MKTPSASQVKQPSIPQQLGWKLLESEVWLWVDSSFTVTLLRKRSELAQLCQSLERLSHPRHRWYALGSRIFKLASSLLYSDWNPPPKLLLNELWRQREQERDSDVWWCPLSDSLLALLTLSACSSPGMSLFQHSANFSCPAPHSRLASCQK